MTTNSGLTEEQFRERMALNGVQIEERFLPGSARALGRALAALGRIDPERLESIEPATVFRARNAGE